MSSPLSDDRLRALERSVEQTRREQIRLDRRISALEQSRLFRLLRAIGYKAKNPPVPYEVWCAREGSPTPQVLRHRPLISVLLPASANREWLDAAIKSVFAQTYPCWELCISAPSMDEPPAYKEPRLRFCQSGKPSFEEAARLAQGEYLALLEDTAVLSPFALQCVAESLQESSPDVVYTDEDQLDRLGHRTNPLLKPDLLKDQADWGHLMVIAKARWNTVGEPLIVRHVPRILYHSRARKETVAPRHQASASTSRCTIIVCTKTAKLLRRCLRGLASGQVLVVAHQDNGELSKIAREYRAEVIEYRGEFNFAEMNNRAAAATKGDDLLFLNDDVVPISKDWLDHLLKHLRRPEVGIAGAKLLYPSGAIQHAGIVLGMGDGVGHAGRGVKQSGLWPWLDRTRSVSAVTGACMAVRREVFAELGGFDSGFPVNYNDVDLCLRARQRGYEVIYEAQAVLRHDECQSRIGMTTLEERYRFSDRWEDLLTKPDPYYNPQLDLSSEEIRLR
jgi:GT2 family glycosyltransferase